MATEHLLDIYYIVRLLLVYGETTIKTWTYGIWWRNFSNSSYSSSNATESGGVWRVDLYRFVHVIAYSNGENIQKDTIRGWRIIKLCTIFVNQKCKSWTFGVRVFSFVGTSREFVSEFAHGLCRHASGGFLFYRLLFSRSVVLFICNRILYVCSV